MKKEKFEEIKRQLFRISQKALVYNAQNEKFLLLRIAQPARDPQKRDAHLYWMKKYGPWDLPGGHVDDGENDLDAAFLREVMEECGITSISDKEMCHTELIINPHANHAAINVIYLVHYSGDIVLSPEHTEFQWMSMQEIMENKEVKKWIKDSVLKAMELKELHESDGRWKRCMADFDNYKKRQVENQKEFIAYAAEGVITDMLPVVDNFHAATDHIPETEKDNPWVTGIMYIQQQMEKIFEEKGVSRMAVNIGDEFDPRTMEAVTNDKEQDLSDDMKVIKIAQPGYKIGEKVLRPARVVLGKNE